MRRNSVRKFIHALVDLLPLFIIPIFAININQKSVEPISIEVQEKVSVDFNQQIHNGNFVDSSYWDSNGGSFSVLNNEAILINSNNRSFFGLSQDLELDENSKYYIRFDVLDVNTTSNTRATILFNSAIEGNYAYYNQYNLSLGYVKGIIDSTYTGRRIYLNFVVDTPNINDSITLSFVNLFNLTKMYGEGNEPSINDFESTFQGNYYTYTDSKKMLVNKPSTTTYDDTDIGSQFLYSLYKPVNDYFNFNNLFNMNDVWNWIQLNLFQGTAPLPVFIIWNIIIYEFFVDLIFLLYGVLMFVIDWSTNMIDSFMNKARRI